MPQVTKQVTNWVERKARREQVLKEKARDVWGDARSAIQNSCNSFRKHYDKTLEDTLENGLRIRITRTFTVHYALATINIKRRLLAAFNESIPCIDVTVDDEPLRRFKIDADESHAFITDQDHEINADQFSESALKHALCTPPEPPRANGPATPAKPNHDL